MLAWGAAVRAETLDVVGAKQFLGAGSMGEFVPRGNVDVFAAAVPAFAGVKPSAYC